MVQIDIAYRGELRCQAKHVPSGQTLITDAPVDNHGKGEAFSPTDLVAAALGGCMLTILGIYGERLGISLEGASATVRKEMVAAPTRRIGRLLVDLHLPGGLDEEQRQKLEQAVRACPVHKSLHPDIEIPIGFHWGQ